MAPNESPDDLEPGPHKVETGDQSRSLSNRIAASASGLLRDIVGGSGANDFSSNLSTALSNGDKAGSSSSSAGSLETTARETSRTANKSAPSKNGARLPPESFHSIAKSNGSVDMEGLQDIDSFQRLSGDDLVLEEDHADPGKGKGKETMIDPVLHGSLDYDEEPRLAAAWDTAGSSFDEFEAKRQAHQDGAEVVALLSNPQFQPYFSFDDSIEDEVDQVYTLSKEEIAAVEELKSRLPPLPIHQSPNWLNPLSLMPNFDEYHFTAMDNGRKRIMPAGRRVPGSEEWIDVAEKYQDEVWGFIEPYAQAAKEEIEDAKSKGETTTTDGPAVRRLGMILEHLKDSKGVVDS